MHCNDGTWSRMLSIVIPRVQHLIIYTFWKTHYAFLLCFGCKPFEVCLSVFAFIHFLCLIRCLTYIIHTCFYCKVKLVAPQHDARSSSLKVGFTTFCIVIAVLALMYSHFTFS